MIGPHTGKATLMSLQRPQARSVGWGAFQTNFGQTQSFDIPPDVRERYVPERHPFWSWHASYLAAANPNENIREICARYLGIVATFAERHRIDAVVVHTGRVSGVPVETVLEGMNDFFVNWEVRSLFELAGVKLAVEHGASTCGFNLYPEVFCQKYVDDAIIGWCLDLAHAPAAGVGWESLRRAIKIKPPTLCHANFPGSTFGSSQDVHGWREHAFYVKEKKKFTTRETATANWFCKEWDETVRLLHGLGVPLIVEGSGFPNGDVQREIEIIRALVGVTG